MKKTGIFLIYFLFASILVFSQENIQKDKEFLKKYNELLLNNETNSVIIKYCDPTFPKFIEGEQNLDMQKYAKMHPSIPIKGTKANDNFNEDFYKTKLDEWIKKYTYYPQFIPYHLYKGGFTIEDDFIFYETAKEIWIKTYRDKYEEIKNEK